MTEQDADKYLATIRELQKLAVRAPHVTQFDIRDIASMPVDELRRRALRARDWHGHFSHCLDGLPALMLLGAAPDGCWDPRTIRRVVEALLAERSRRAPAVHVTQALDVSADRLEVRIDGVTGPHVETFSRQTPVGESKP